MKYFFEDLIKCEALYQEVRSWLRTPFKHGVGVKNMGCDCIHFVLRVYENIGAIKSGILRVPSYPKDWHVHNTEELLFNKFTSLSMFEELEMEDAVPVIGVMDGDIFLHKYGLASSHSAVYCRDKLYHSINGVGVQDTAWYDEKWSKTRTNGFRMLVI